MSYNILSFLLFIYKKKRKRKIDLDEETHLNYPPSKLLVSAEVL